METGRRDCCSLLVWISLSLGLVYCAPDGGHGGSWIHSNQLLTKRDMQYCGFRLVEALRSLCQGNYAALTRRSDPTLGSPYEEEVKNGIDKFLEYSPSPDVEPDTWDNVVDNSLSSADFDSMWPKSPKALAMRILTEGPSHRRFRRSVSDECCKQPCGARTMLKYCGGRQ